MDGIHIEKKFFFVSLSMINLNFSLLNLKIIKFTKLVKIDIGSKILSIEIMSNFKIKSKGVPTNRIPTPAILCKIIKKKIGI